MAEERRGRPEQLFLNAGRALMLYGALTVVSTVGSPATNATQAFLVFLLWMLGVSLLSLMPAAGRFNPAARVPVVVALAVAVIMNLKYFSPRYEA